MKTLLKTIRYSIYLALVILFSCANNPNYTEKKQNSKNNIKYFKIVDSPLTNKSNIKIENIDRKNGFKNILLGSYFLSYEFNNKEWEITDDNYPNITEAVYKVTNDNYSINNAKLESIRLVFFMKKLIIIEIESSIQKGTDLKILPALKELYGEPTQNFSNFDYGSYKFLFGYNNIFHCFLLINKIFFQIIKIQCGLHLPHIIEIKKPESMLESHVIMKNSNGSVKM
jgi:hypothetical protein